LEEFVANIDTPALTIICIRFYNQLIFNIQKTCQFLSRMETPKFLCGVVVGSFPNIITINLCQRVGGTRDWECDLGILCTQLDWQLSSVTQILSQLSPLLPKVDKLAINAYPTVPAGKEDVDSTQLLELFQPFPYLGTVSVAERFVPGIAHALVTEDMATDTFPALQALTLRGYHKSPSVAKAAKKFTTMRKLSGHRVFLYDSIE